MRGLESRAPRLCATPAALAPPRPLPIARPLAAPRARARERTRVRLYRRPLLCYTCRMQSTEQNTPVEIPAKKTFSQRALSPTERFEMMLPHRLELAAVLHHLQRLPSAEQLSQMTLLDIGMPNPVMSEVLRKRGGNWCTVARSPAFAQEAADYLGSDVACLGGDGTIPYENGVFDVVIVALDILVAVSDQLAFIKECNRVLKSSGMLIISAQAKRALSIGDFIRNRRWNNPHSPYAATYTETSLYSTIKNGFDIQDVNYFSRFWVDLVRIREAKLVEQGHTSDEIALRLRTLYRIAHALDRFDLLQRGHVVILSARRRRWSARVMPVLGDGRTLSEAVLFRPPA